MYPASTSAGAVGTLRAYSEFVGMPTPAKGVRQGTLKYSEFVGMPTPAKGVAQGALKYSDFAPLPAPSQPVPEAAGAGKATSGTGAGPGRVGPAATVSLSNQVTAQAAGSGDKAADPSGLTEEERAVVEKLKQRDREVRAHEQAHMAVGGQYAGAVTYVYQKGPDGQRYAIGGEVPIDVSPEDDPEKTIEKMEQVKAAALAPKDPSSADRQVAATADKYKAEAQAQLREMERAELEALQNGEDPEAAKEAAKRGEPAGAAVPGGGGQALKSPQEAGPDRPAGAGSVFGAAVAAYQGAAGLSNATARPSVFAVAA